MGAFLDKRPPAASAPRDGCEQTPALCWLPRGAAGFWERENA